MVLDAIKKLSNVHDVGAFFTKNDLSKLTEDELRTLSVKIAQMNLEYKFDNYQNLVMSEIANRKTKWWHFWVPVIIALASLIVSIFKK